MSDTTTERKRPLIYVSGPYRAATDAKVLDNISAAWNDAVQLWKAGAAVICPHTNTTNASDPFLNAGMTAKEWIEGDLVMIERCDAIYMRTGWKDSKGATEEWSHAVVNEIPIYTCMGDLLSDISVDSIGDLADLPPISPRKLTDINDNINSAIESQKGNPKDATGSSKTPFHLVPESATAQEAEAMRLGASKYGAYNWRSKAVKASVYVSALRRHLAAWFDREDNDPESGLSHLAHARANLGILLDAEHCGQLIDDRPVPVPEKKSFLSTVDDFADKVRNLRGKIEANENEITRINEKADALR